MNKIVSKLSKIFLGGIIERKLIKKIYGSENIPQNENFILATNHLSHADWFMCGYLCAPRQFVFIGQVDKYTGFNFNAFMRNLIYWWASTIPIDRTKKESKKSAFSKAVGMLENDYCLIIYPEGTRSRDGLTHEFKPGVGMLYLDSGVKILPAALKGTNIILPPHGKLKFAKTAQISVGKPLEFKDELAAAKKIDRNSQEYKDLCLKVAKKVEDNVRDLLQKIPD